MNIRALLFLGLLLTAAARPALSHEYWIDAQKFQPTPDEEVTADLRVGSDLSGEVFPWLRQSFRSVLLWSPGQDPLALGGRAGDLPALRLPPLAPGLHRISVETTPSFVLFEDMEKFEKYLEYEGLAATLDLHRSLGLPESDFGERYVRNARALIQSGPVTDADVDAPTGMAFELVAEANPYAAGRTDLPVRLIWQGQPVAGAQVALFHAPPDATPPDGVTRLLFTTDADGRVTVPLRGAGLHLLSAVRIEPLEGSVAAVWQSWWASLTFAP